MTDEVQTPETPAPAPEAATTQADYQRLMDGNPEPEPEPKPEPKTVPLDAMLDRVGRVKRQRDEAREAAYLREGQIEDLREIVVKLRSLKADDFPTLDAYEAARADLDARAEKAALPQQPQVSEHMLREVHQAAKDLAADLKRSDPDLWAEATAKVERDGQQVDKYAIPPAVVIAIADADDSAGLLRAYLDLDDEDRQEIIDLSERGQKKAIRALQPKAKAAKAAEPAEAEGAKAERDPATGQFTKRVSQAPAPINPLSGSSVAQKSIDAMSPDEFIAHRNNQQRGERFGWA